jgi:hypothetical protein
MQSRKSLLRAHIIALVLDADEVCHLYCMFQTVVPKCDIVNQYISMLSLYVMMFIVLI